MDFVDKFYYGIDGWSDDSADRARAHQSAISKIIPIIIENKLTERQSLCFRYKYLSGKNQQEIASLLQLSQPTVSRHINAAKDIINDALKYCYVAVSKGLDEYEKLNDM